MQDFHERQDKALLQVKNPRDTGLFATNTGLTDLTFGDNGSCWVRFPTSHMSFARPEDLDSRDYKYIIEDGDEGFSPRRNQHVIENTIKLNDERNRQSKKEYIDKIEERVDAGMAWLKHVDHYGKSTSLEKYLGKNYLAQLRGDDIRNTLVTKLSQKAWQNQTPIRRSRPDSH